jgi:hypothetical protein
LHLSAISRVHVSKVRTVQESREPPTRRQFRPDSSVSLSFESRIHARVRRGVERQRPNWPAGCWPIAVGPHHGPSRPARRPAQEGMVRGQGSRARLVPIRSGAPHRHPPPCTVGHRTEQSRGAPSRRGH